ncbi:MAG: Ig-like domain-containing protein [Anaerolineae bacterium]|nr:Ig-like domain-containing protein [Anaerolineae bacterium]
MRLIAYAGLALALVLAAAVLLIGGPQLTWADTSSPQSSDGLAPSQAVDDVQIEMLLNGQPETLFPAEVLNGSTVVTPGTRSVTGRVRYNITPFPSETSAFTETIKVFDPAGIVVHTENFSILASASTGVHTFTVTGDEMFSVYRQLASARLTTAKSQADSLQPATTALVTDTISTLTSLATVASEANTALDRILKFTEVVTPTRTSVARAQSEIQTASSTADNLARLGIAIPEFCNRFADPGQRQTCQADVARKVGVYNTDLPRLKAAATAALAAYNEAAAALAGLTNLQIPAIDGCGTSGGRPVPRTYTSNVVEARQGGEPQTRDSWEWQVGNPSTFKANATLLVVPPQIYMLNVTPPVPHQADVLASIYDTRCLPVRDDVEVAFRSTIGVIDPITVTTYSEAGVHGLARTTLRAGDTPGPGLVSIVGLTTLANVTVIGPATQLTFLSASGAAQTQRYIRQGDTTVEFQVQVRDARGSVVADGTQVEFTVTENAGQFSQSIVTTVNGMARVTFTARQTPLAAAVVTAHAVGTQASAQLNIAIVGLPANIQLGVSQGYSTTLYIGSRNDQYPNFTFVEATVTDAAGSPVADGTEVELRLSAANRAFWEDPAAGTNGLATRVVTSGGKARAKLQVLDDTSAGSLNVIASIGTLRSAPLSLTLSADVPNPPPTRWSIYLPMILRQGLCGKPTGGCQGPQ